MSLRIVVLFVYVFVFLFRRFFPMEKFWFIFFLINQTMLKPTSFNLYHHLVLLIYSLETPEIMGEGSIHE